MSDQGELYEKSWILYHVLDRFIGSQEIVAIRRKLTVFTNQVRSSSGCMCEKFTTGSRAEGIHMQSSDLDIMSIDKSVIVMCPDKDTSHQIDSANKSVLMMREADSRPGYVNLELLCLGQTCHSHFLKSIVQVGDVQLLSSELFRQACDGVLSKMLGLNTETHGPAVTLKPKQNKTESDIDKVTSFPCYDWPTEGDEWMSRPRLYGWPDKALRDEIVQGGCQLVPVGDKTSANPFLQWRISFVTAERKLMYSLSHVQFLVYGLLKYVQKQISGKLDQILDEEDIVSSYILKTVLFHAVESTPESFWQEKHLFFCFMFCLKILVILVKAGQCPNYFIKSNNMFLGKVRGENQRKLSHFLNYLYSMNWGCLSVGTVIQPTIGERIRSVRNGSWECVLPTPIQSERERDSAILFVAFTHDQCSDKLPLALKPLLVSGSDIDEFLGYFATVRALSNTGMKIFGEPINARGDRDKYKSIRICKNLFKPFSTVSTSIRLLSMATFYYKTGNYLQALEICYHVMSSSKIYLHSYFSVYHNDRYRKLYCGRGYSLLQKCQAFISDITFTKEAQLFCPSQLRREIAKLPHGNSIRIPPLQYVTFLSFLCYHEHGDTQRRNTSLMNLRFLKSDPYQVARKHWVVHNLLGICFEMTGDRHSALREYMESLKSPGDDQHHNAAKERIECLHYG